MRRAFAPVVVLLTLTATAVAQDFERQRDEGRGRGRRGRGPSISRIVERLSEKIDFDEEQSARIDEIVAAHEERMQEVRARRQEMRAAMEAGDEERVAELREQLRQQRGERGRVLRTVLDEIEPLLHEDQVKAFQQFREDFAQRRGPGGRGRMGEMIRGLPDAVNMTEDQRKKFEELLAGRRERMRERMRERRRQGEAGGFEAAERRGPPDFAAMQDELFKEVAEILNEDQLELLAEYWVPIGSEAGAREGQRTDDFRVVLSAAKRLRDLSSDQKQAFQEITRQAMRSFRDLRRTDEKGKAALDAEVKSKVLRQLDEQQREKFERDLERLKSHKKRAERERRARRDRPARRDRRERGSNVEQP